MANTLEVELVPDLGGVDPADWDSLAGTSDPFSEHGFLRALETSKTVGEGTGWRPLHVLVNRGKALVGALPLYAKFHSYGEYIFDWAWAHAADRMGVSYYPKLVSMIPVTPVTGTRLLIKEGEDREIIARAILAGVFSAADAVEASSVHLNFLTQNELGLVTGGKLKGRKSLQFHWDNEGYKNFDTFLSRFRSSARKQVRKERRRVQEGSLTTKVLTGTQMNDAVWEAIPRFYLDTCGRKGSHPYLTPEFFAEIRENFAHRVLAAVAFDGEVPVAASFNFQKGSHLYGRYWGATADYDALHFELCYYQLIEHAIDNGMQHFEAGAQGMHKVKRGLLPVVIHSAHWVRNPALSEAVFDFLDREALEVEREVEYIAERGPFHRNHHD